MRGIFTPSFKFPSVADIPDGFFKDNGIKYVVCDIDNTLIDDNKPEPDERAFRFIARLKRMGVGICLVSNNKPERVASFNRELKLPAINRAHKPLPFKIRRALKHLGAERANTVLIGDQLFTDIAGGNAAGLKTILVEPINIGIETRFFKLKRYFERKISKG